MTYRDAPSGFFVHLESIVRKIEECGINKRIFLYVLRNAYHPEEAAERGKKKMEDLFADISQMVRRGSPEMIFERSGSHIMIGIPMTLAKDFKASYERSRDDMIEECNMKMSFLMELGKSEGITEQMWQAAAEMAFSDG